MTHYHGVDWECSVRWQTGGPGQPDDWHVEIIDWRTVDPPEWRARHGAEDPACWLHRTGGDEVAQQAIDEAEAHYEAVVLDRRVEAASE